MRSANKPEVVMEFLTQLWLPIVVSAVIVFILSALAWTVMPHHKKDFTGRTPTRFRR